MIPRKPHMIPRKKSNAATIGCIAYTILTCLYFLAMGAFCVFVAYVAWHFIAKFW